MELNSWQVYLDSNQGMAASKAAALPLGDRPTSVNSYLLLTSNMVRKERLELSHLAAPEPKSGASTNFAISAKLYFYNDIMVRKERLELSHLAAPEPKSGASTNFAISAKLYFYNDIMVRKERLELSHLAAPEPKSGASTNFATSASRYCT